MAQLVRLHQALPSPDLGAAGTLENLDIFWWPSKSRVLSQVVPEIFFPGEPQGAELTLEQNLGVAQGLVALRVTRLFLDCLCVLFELLF